MRIGRLYRGKKYLLHIFLWINCIIILTVSTFSALVYYNVGKFVASFGRPGNQPLDTILLLAGAAFAIAFVLTLSASRELYRPVRRLMEQMTSAGEIQAAAARSHPRDEFAYLAEVYSLSRERLYEYRSENNRNASIMNFYFLKKLLADSPGMNATEFEDALHRLNGALSADKPLLVCVLRIDGYGSFLSERSLAERELVRFAIGNVAAELLSRSFVAEVVDMKDDAFAILMNAEDDSGAEADRPAKLSSLLREAQTYILRHYGLSFTASFGEPIADYADLAAEYASALGNSSYRYAFGTSSVITPALVAGRIGNADPERIRSAEDEFIEAAREEDPIRAGEKLRELLRHHRKLEYGEMRLAGMRLVRRLKRTIHDANRTRREPLAIPPELLGREFGEEETIEGFERRLLDAVASLGDGGKVTARHGDLAEAEAEALRDLIESNYFDSSLSAAGISGLMKLSAYKLGKIAKKHLGMSVTEYINQVRLARAIDWLENSNLSVQEVMRRIGMENESYFYRLFKAKQGMTPKEYRSQHSR